MYDCPQCGDATPRLHEGYCEDCCRENQQALDAHNAGFDAWEATPEDQRGRIIREAISLALRNAK